MAAVSELAVAHRLLRRHPRRQPAARAGRAHGRAEAARAAVPGAHRLGVARRRSRRIRSSPTSRWPAAAPRSPTTARRATVSAAPARASTPISPTTPGSGAAPSTTSTPRSSTASAAITSRRGSTRCRRSARDMLSRSEISDVAEHVLALSGRHRRSRGRGARAADLRRAMRRLPRRAGPGHPELGGPALADAIWQYGGTKAEIVAADPQPPPRRHAGLGRAARAPRPSRSWPSTSTPWAAASEPARWVA